MMDKVDYHKKICAELSEIYEKKNNDYGNSFSILRDEYPDSILIRIFDKYNRLKTLIKGETQQVNDESIDDTLVDMANYCIMELIERNYNGWGG